MPARALSGQLRCPRSGSWRTGRTKRKPEEDAAGPLGPAPALEFALERLTEARVRIVSRGLTARLREGADSRRHRQNDGPESTSRLEDEDCSRDLEKDGWAAQKIPSERKRNNSIVGDRLADREAACAALQDEEGRDSPVVGDRDTEHHRRSQEGEEGSKERKAGEAGCQRAKGVSAVDALV